MNLAEYILNRSGFTGAIAPDASREEVLLLAGQVAGENWPEFLEEYRLKHPNLGMYGLSHAAFGRHVVDIVCDNNADVKRFYGKVSRGVKPDAKCQKKRIEIKGIRLRRGGEPCLLTEEWQPANINRVRVDCADFIVLGVFSLENSQFFALPTRAVRHLPGFSSQQTADSPEAQVSFTKQTISAWGRYAVPLSDIGWAVGSP